MESKAVYLMGCWSRASTDRRVGIAHLCRRASPPSTQRWAVPTLRDQSESIHTRRRPAMTCRTSLGFIALSVLLSSSALGDVAGKWEGQVETPVGMVKYSYDLQPQGTAL